MGEGKKMAWENGEPHPAISALLEVEERPISPRPVGPSNAVNTLSPICCNSGVKVIFQKDVL